MPAPGPCDILLHVAMLSEARPLLDLLALDAASPLDPALPAHVWRRADGGPLAMVVHGIDPEHACDRIGTETATLVSHLAIRSMRPKLVINAGTCGGFESRGATIGAIYVPSRYLFHDQRVALPRFSEFARGMIDADAPLSAGGTSAPPGDPRSASAAAAAMGAARGTLATGSSLDAMPDELALFDLEGVVAKDMEGAAIARVCRDLRTPLVAVKAVTDMVDHHADTAAQFVRNLDHATDCLGAALVRLLGTLAPRARVP
jgi:5'-methylthioadenosine nucleosidase